MRYTFEVFKGEDGMWRYRMVANPRSGLREVMFVSQAYRSGRRGAWRGALAAQQAAAEAPIVATEA